jgi:hypothetical protein
VRQDVCACDLCSAQQPYFCIHVRRTDKIGSEARFHAVREREHFVSCVIVIAVGEGVHGSRRALRRVARDLLEGGWCCCEVFLISDVLQNYTTFVVSDEKDIGLEIDSLVNAACNTVCAGVSHFWCQQYPSFVPPMRYVWNTVQIGARLLAHIHTQTRMMIRVSRAGSSANRQCRQALLARLAAVAVRRRRVCRFSV